MPEYQFGPEHVNAIYVINGKASTVTIPRATGLVAILVPTEKSHTVEYDPTTNTVTVVFRDDVEEEPDTETETSQNTVPEIIVRHPAHASVDIFPTDS